MNNLSSSHRGTQTAYCFENRFLLNMSQSAAWVPRDKLHRARIIDLCYCSITRPHIQFISYDSYDIMLGRYGVFQKFELRDTFSTSCSSNCVRTWTFCQLVSSIILIYVWVSSLSTRYLSWYMPLHFLWRTPEVWRADYFEHKLPKWFYTNTNIRLIGIQYHLWYISDSPYSAR